MGHLERASKRDVTEVFKHCRDLHTVYSHHKKGWTNDREKSMRHVTSIPLWVIFSDEHKKYFDPKQDPHELRKNIDKWIKKNDWFDFRQVK